MLLGNVSVNKDKNGTLTLSTYSHFVFFSSTEAFSVIILASPAESLKVVVRLEPVGFENKVFLSVSWIRKSNLDHG